MKLFFTYIKDAINYTFSDIFGIWVISTLLTITSLISKDAYIDKFWSIITVTLLIVAGYGSYVSWYTLKGSDEHPQLNKNTIKKLTWEGFKKSVIIFIYSIGLTFLYHQAKTNFTSENLLISTIYMILFLLLYLCLIGGLLNRYLYHGEFKKAFDLLEIIKLISIFDLKSFIMVIVAVIISQTFTISVVIGFNTGFSFIEFIHFLSTYFLSPFLYITIKRLVGLTIYNLLKESKIERK